MMVPLTQLEVVGMRRGLDPALAALQDLRLAEVVTVVEPRNVPTTLLDLTTRVDSLCALFGPPATGPAAPALSDAALGTTLDRLEPEVATLLADAESLRAEAEALPRSIDALDAVQPLVPELARLNDRQLASLGLVSMALVLDDPDQRIVPELARRLGDLLGRGHLLATAAATPGSPVGCLLILRRSRLPEVQALLGSERILQAGVPAAYANRSLRATVEAMRERLSSLPAERARARHRLDELLSPVAASLRATADALRARAERSVAAGQADLSARTFTLRLWVPTARTTVVEQALASRLGAAVAVERLPAGERREDRPVLLWNRAGWQPFQQLVGFLSWPARGGLDPTGLMAVGLPIFFGIMVGDVVYGGLMLAIAWGLRTHWSDDHMAGEVSRVLTVGGWWAVLFGVLYGEALGSLGHRVGMPALWFYRAGPAALESLLLFSLAVGLLHVVLGLLLGLSTAAHAHQRRDLVAKGGTLLALLGLCGLAAVTAVGLPTVLLLPATVAFVGGVGMACASRGALGLILGPLELLGTVGNVLSYLRLAAVGLASTYLAEVANELGARGPLLLGIVVAVLFHALNLALAAFSPMIQALRLHYVEFFGQFHEGGGRLFAPLGGAVDLDPPTHRAATLRAPTRTTPAPVPAGSGV
jgi:V/A-type H+/Na+-transporting ATPase subunit I